MFNKAALAPAEYALRIPAAISAGGNTAPTLPITNETMPVSVALFSTELLKYSKKNSKSYFRTF